MRHQRLRAAQDPSEVAAAQLLSGSERQEDPQPSRISESTSPLDRRRECSRIGESVAHTLRDIEIEAEKIAGVTSCHAVILTTV